MTTSPTAEPKEPTTPLPKLCQNCGSVAAAMVNKRWRCQRCIDGMKQSKR